MFLTVGADAYIAAGAAIALVKVIDVIVTLFLVCLFYRLLPKSMKAD